MVVDAPGQLDTRGDGEVEIATAAACRKIVQGCRTPLGARGVDGSSLLYSCQQKHGVWT